jgi:RNA polymerase sigma factor (sigma-70 family)
MQSKVSDELAAPACARPVPAKGRGVSPAPMTVAQANLVIEHLRYARSLACRFFATSPDPTWDREECVACAYLGLVKAAQRWDPGRGVPFTAYARTRIWGEIMDALEVSVDWKHPVALEDMTAAVDGEVEWEAPAGAQSPEDQAIDSEWTGIVRLELDELAPVSRRVVLAWAGGASKASISRNLGIPPGRVYKIITSAMVILRESPVLAEISGAVPQEGAQMGLFSAGR